MTAATIRPTAKRPRRHWKWWLFIVHRWIGIVTCLLFAIWFVSGLVMIYVPFPSLTRNEALAHLPPIDWGQVRTPPPMEGTERASLEMAGDHPVWRVSRWDGKEQTLSATNSTALGPADAAEAQHTAERFARAPVTAIETVERDQWTVAGGFNRHRPLWKATIAGPGGRILYVSSHTGAVVLDTSARERLWNWLGSVPHWIYLTVLRQDNAAWRQVVMWVSGLCIIGAVTGMWIGILRTRLGRRRFSQGRTTPYHGWMEWHHWTGLIGGLFLLAWIFSGWLSVDPFRLFASHGIGDAERIAYSGTAPFPPLALPSLAAGEPEARRVTLYRAAGRPLALVERQDGSSSVLDAATLSPANLDGTALVTAARRLMPGAPIVAVDRLTGPDTYWYEVGALPVLPVLRVRYGDPAATWAHIDPANGRLLGDLDRRRRLYRWAFDLLHKWDLNGLTLHRPAWDALLWLASLVGLATSVTGIWIGFRRLRH
ncbi:PepSY domain-containing protein [Sphingomonas sp. MMS24-J13]|uniref:PepSY domain-containing protein n=1 Tax=Sphingomonas sp. MMS24-J13 TaxID=3238686 RepID=UPI003850396C